MTFAIKKSHHDECIQNSLSPLALCHTRRFGDNLHFLLSKSKPGSLSPGKLLKQLKASVSQHIAWLP